MTAAYDDDTISSRRQENVENSDVPVDFNGTQKITAATGTLDNESAEKSSGVEEDGATMSEDYQDARAGQSTKEIIFSQPNSEAVSKTVDYSITDRCSVDVVAQVVNKEDINCTISENRGNGASDSTCSTMLAKQKNVEEIITETEENLSRIDLRNSFIVCGTASQERGKKINQNDNHNIIDDKLLSTKESGKIISSEDRRSVGAVTTGLTNNIENKINRDQKKDLNCNLTDENKSDELGMVYQESELIEDEISSVNSNPQQKGSVKRMPVDECCSSALANACGEKTAQLIHSIEDQKIVPQKKNGRSKVDSIHSEVSAGNIFEVKNDSPTEFLREQLDLEDYDPECEMSFHEAVRAGDAKSVEMLIARGAVQNIDEPDWNVSGDPPLLVAATNHSLPVLRVLLSNGCDPGVRSPRGETALHRAILNGSPSSVFEMVEELLKYGCPSTVKEAGGGLTALHVQTRQLVHAQNSKSLQHNFDIALKTLELLAKVGPVDAQDHQGRSALHLLASSSTFGNSHRIEIEPMIRTLLDAGADPALKNDRGETPLHEALERGALNTGFLLIPYTPIGITSRYGETPLHIAARKNQTEVVDSLLKRGEDPGFQDAGGNTPLHLASARGFHHTVSLLVTSPLAQLEKTNDEGLTSLQVAAESGFVNAVRLLLKAGADPSQTAHYCVTTLHRHPDISVLINHELTRRRQLAA